MRNKTIAWITAIETFLMMISFATMPIATAAGSITLTPSAQAPGASVTVAGTGFGTTKNVAIGFGAEISGNDSNIALVVQEWARGRAKYLTIQSNQARLF